MRRRTKTLRAGQNGLAAAILLAFSLAPSTVYAQGWIDQRVYGPLVCNADFPLADVEPLLAEVAQIQQELIRLLAIPPANERIQLLLFRDRSAYRRYLAQYLPNVPYRQALYVRSAGQGTVLAFRSDDLPIDVRHECTHALLHSVLPMVPLWLDEGLAEYFEVPAAERPLKNPHHSTVVWWMRFGRVPSMQRLEARQTLDDMGRTEYREAWAYAHYLLNGPPAVRTELVSYLADIRNGTPPGQLSQRLGRMTPDLPGELVEHFKTFK
jgi:hypothetical protein